MYCAVAAPVASAWAVMGQLGITFIPAAVYHFTVGTLAIYSKHKSRVWLAWLVSGFFFVTALYSDAFISGVNHFWWGYYARSNSMCPFWFFFGSVVSTLLAEYHAGTWREKLRSKHCSSLSVWRISAPSIIMPLACFLPVRSPGCARFHHPDCAGRVAL
jgi:hypothetical protein